MNFFFQNPFPYQKYFQHKSLTEIMELFSGTNLFKRKTHETFPKKKAFLPFKDLSTISYKKKCVFQNEALFFKWFSQIKSWDFLKIQTPFPKKNGPLHLFFKLFHTNVFAKVNFFFFKLQVPPLNFQVPQYKYL